MIIVFCFDELYVYARVDSVHVRHIVPKTAWNSVKFHGFLKLLSLQIDWLNAYYKKVQDTIGPLLINTDKVAHDWLTRRTGGITHSVNVAVKNMAPFNHIVILLTITLFCVVGNFEDIFCI